MNDLIRKVYRNAVEHSEEIKILDEIIERKLAKLGTVRSQTIDKEAWEQIDDIVLDMIAEVTEEAFILGFRYAAILWTEAVFGGEEDRDGR